MPLNGITTAPAKYPRTAPSVSNSKTPIAAIWFPSRFRSFAYNPFSALIAVCSLAVLAPIVPHGPHTAWAQRTELHAMLLSPSLLVLRARQLESNMIKRAILRNTVWKSQPFFDGLSSLVSATIRRKSTLSTTLFF